MADNTGQATQSLRIRKLNVTAPPALAQHFVQAGVFDDSVNLNALCGEGGTGSLNWLLRFDSLNHALETGGAPPSSNPFTTGYCFVHSTVSGFAVAPATVSLTQQAGGAFSSDAIPKLYMPVYLNGDPTNAFILPISAARFSGMTLSAGGNCIGAYNADGVTAPTSSGICADQDPSSCQRWHTAGSFSGFITLKEADTVNVVTLGKSLCVLLTNGTSTTNGGQNCATDAAGSIVAQGDFCSQTSAAGGCADSSWMAATFAASAAKIDTTSTDPACNGG
jgi:hypothetical protein